MAQLRKVGFLYNLPLEARRVALRSMARESPDTDEDRIVNYLESGIACASVLLVEEDPLTDPPRLIGAPNVRTDGVWAWPETLTYYVRHYHVALPPEFILHLSLNGWRCPPECNVDGLSLEGEQPI